MFAGAYVCGVHTQHFHKHTGVSASVVGCVVAGVFEDCCLAYHQHTGRAMLRRARGYLLQEVSGSCNLPAVM